MNIVVKVKSEIIEAILKKECSNFVTKMYPQRYDIIAAYDLKEINF